MRLLSAVCLGDICLPNRLAAGLVFLVVGIIVFAVHTEWRRKTPGRTACTRCGHAKTFHKRSGALLGRT